MNLLKAVGILKNAGLDIEVSESKKNGSSAGMLLVNISGLIMGHQDVLEMAQSHQRQATINGLRDLLAIVTWGAELQTGVEAEMVKFFEMQQMVWLHLEDAEDFEAYPESVIETEALNSIEDVTNSNSDPERYYPIVGTEDVPTNAPPKEEVVNPVEVITELKQEALTLPVRVIEFKVNGSTFTRVVRKADKAAFASIKADIKKAVEDGSLCSTIQAIIPTLHVRPGFVYVNA